MINENGEIKVISVSELNNYIKLLFDNTITLKNIALHGEISNFNGANRSGHLYFSLNDETSSIRVVMFKYDSLSLLFEPKNGDEVILYGGVSSYPPNGTYQIIAKKIELFGQGNLLIQKEKLKAKLFKEGYFDEKHKKELPKYPNSIGLITGKNSAAQVDVVTNVSRRFPLAKITIFNSLVQGDSAPKDLINALNKAESANLDIIIIARGGGSLEDLSAFDNEELVKEIYKCEIPIISAVGHEINRSFCDYVADKYVSTPTGAAELAVPDQSELLENLKQTKNYIDQILNDKINSYSIRLKDLSNNKCLKDIAYNYDKNIEKLMNYRKYLDNYLKNKFLNLDSLVKSKTEIIETLNPKKLLEKGYSIVYNDEGLIINSTKSVKDNQKLKIQMSDGIIQTKVANIGEKNNG